MELNDEAREVAERFTRLPAHQRLAVLNLLRALTETPKSISGRELAELISEGILSDEEAADLERFLYEYRASTIRAK
ncbi:MAG: hypothetical protein ACK4RG_10330, partial [Fimbriimonadales bacterium]